VFILKLGADWLKGNVAGNAGQDIGEESERGGRAGWGPVFFLGEKRLRGQQENRDGGSFGGVHSKRHHANVSATWARKSSKMIKRTMEKKKNMEKWGGGGLRGGRDVW